MVDDFSDFGLEFLGDARFFQLFPVVFGFLFLAYRITQAVMDGLDFLTQVIVLLFLVHFGPHVTVDFRFQPADLDFLVQQVVNQAEPVHHIRFFQYVLTLAGRKEELGRKEVRRFAGVRNLLELLHLFIGKALFGVSEPFKEGF